VHCQLEVIKTLFLCDVLMVTAGAIPSSRSSKILVEHPSHFVMFIETVNRRKGGEALHHLREATL